MKFFSGLPFGPLVAFGAPAAVLLLFVLVVLMRRDLMAAVFLTTCGGACGDFSATATATAATCGGESIGILASF